MAKGKNFHYLGMITAGGGTAGRLDQEEQHERYFA
jgi:hypothetical protein